VLADAATGDTEAVAERLAQVRALHDAGRYPSGGVVLDTARGMAAYASGSLQEAVDILVPVLPQLERTGGSRAQEDLIEFTVYKAHVELGWTEALHAFSRRGAAGLVRRR
jgi:hypothetical protein